MVASQIQGSLGPRWGVWWPAGAMRHAEGEGERSSMKIEEGSTRRAPWLYKDAAQPGWRSQSSSPLSCSRSHPSIHSASDSQSIFTRTNELLRLALMISKPNEDKVPGHAPKNLQKEWGLQKDRDLWCYIRQYAEEDLDLKRYSRSRAMRRRQTSAKAKAQEETRKAMIEQRNSTTEETRNTPERSS